LFQSMPAASIAATQSAKLGARGRSRESPSGGRFRAAPRKTSFCRDTVFSACARVLRQVEVVEAHLAEGHGPGLGRPDEASAARDSSQSAPISVGWIPAAKWMKRDAPSQDARTGASRQGSSPPSRCRRPPPPSRAQERPAGIRHGEGVQMRVAVEKPHRPSLPLPEPRPLPMRNLPLPRSSRALRRSGERPSSAEVPPPVPPEPAEAPCGR
jgi:hypothetical protein